ncbi:hypothetical protein MIND_00742800 [Mycena indigotica]|uniref:Uncharacterized protein n=1 Tax=Mycena indigotica TaxID=2126181 RepID=A0A8H6W1P8_9AGAR|nr:uncharacterized protein MIND_00742800 [Mycena indigotica]KAF7301772.1 hypothetical protein MIND_00742800 [Mycena indigotica]
MKFRTRNPLYLRVSQHHVLPLYLYLDERHVSWMSETVLQHVLADLQPKILPKLRAEADVHAASAASAKKPTVDTHRGDSYQFCYFIRRTEQHSALIKTRYFTAAPPQSRAPPPHQGSKRKGRKESARTAPNKRRKTKGKGKASDEGDDAALSSGGEEDAAQSNLDDVEMDDVAPNEIESTPIDIDQDDDEEKPKPALSLTYQNFSIYGQCLCVVVEPYPPLRSSSIAPSRAPSIAPVFATARQQSVAPTPISGGSAQRARTPLFLPDDEDEREGSVIPPESKSRQLPPVPLFSPDDPEEEDNGGMMAFSQVMTSYSHLPAGMVEDDDELDGAVFFGDADEMKELYD